jgi:PAS domain S-box-containing protein
MNGGSPPSESPPLELALEEAREKLRFQEQLLDSVGQAIISTDVMGNITYVNSAAERLFLWTSAEVVGRKIGEVTKTSVTREQSVEIISRLSRGESWTGEFLFSRKDGTHFVGEVVNWPIRNSDGKLIGVSGTALDLTERRALESELRQAQKLEVIGRLAGGIAHDFNNILQAMLLNIQLLQLDSDRSSEDQESLDELKALTERAAMVTSQLLIFARRQAVQLQSIELNSALLRTIELLRRLLGEHITVRLEAAPQPLWIDVDSGMLDQVIMNLCLNARDAMPNGGELVLSTANVVVDQEFAHKHADARPGEYACLSVRDTGSGISPALLEHIFEPFFTTKETGKGTGLGLAAVYGIVRQHRGFVSIHSSLGNGSTFSVYLPLSPRSARTNKNDSADSAGGVSEHTLPVAEDTARDCLG